MRIKAGVEMPNESRSIATASSAYLGAVAVLNGLLGSVGLIISLYTYFKFPHLTGIEHSAKNVWVESIESYIFVFPAFQVALFLVPAVFYFRWNTFLRRAVVEEEKQRSDDPALRRLDSILLYYWLCVLLAASAVGLLGLTIYRSIMLATNSV
jgi:hypothetical protein